jgi:hypothetical protein
MVEDEGLVEAIEESHDREPPLQRLYDLLHTLRRIVRPK